MDNDKRMKFGNFPLNNYIIIIAVSAIIIIYILRLEAPKYIAVSDIVKEKEEENLRLSEELKLYKFRSDSLQKLSNQLTEDLLYQSHLVKEKLNKKYEELRKDLDNNSADDSIDFLTDWLSEIGRDTAGRYDSCYDITSGTNIECRED